MEVYYASAIFWTVFFKFRATNTSPNLGISLSPDIILLDYNHFIAILEIGNLVNIKKTMAAAAPIQRTINNPPILWKFNASGLSIFLHSTKFALMYLFNFFSTIPRSVSSYIA